MTTIIEDRKQRRDNSREILKELKPTIDGLHSKMVEAKRGLTETRFTMAMSLDDLEKLKELAVLADVSSSTVVRVLIRQAAEIIMAGVPNV